MKPGSWLPRLVNCATCHTQVVVLKRGKRTIYRRHTTSGEWATKCALNV